MCACISIINAPSVDLDSATAHFAIPQTGQPVTASRRRRYRRRWRLLRSAPIDAEHRSTSFEYDESYLAHGYKELTIPPGADGSWRMEKNALHIWPRKSFMMIALPNPDGSFTCTLFWEFEGPRSFATTKTDDDVRRFFDEEFPDAVPLMPTLLEDFRQNPTGSLVTIRCAPWFYRDKVALVGDAAHAVVPFYGQGMNAAFEDCVVLDECLARVPEQSRTRIRRILCAAKRKRRRAGRSRDRQFHRDARQDRVERHFARKRNWITLLEGLLPGIYLPLYTMVTFTRIPYARPPVARAGKTVLSTRPSSRLP